MAATCDGCDHRILDIYAYCPGCGQQLGDVPDHRDVYLCEECRSPVRPGHRYCPYCGTPFEDPPEGVTDDEAFGALEGSGGVGATFWIRFAVVVLVAAVIVSVLLPWVYVNWFG